MIPETPDEKNESAAVVNVITESPQKTTGLACSITPVKSDDSHSCRPSKRDRSIIGKELFINEQFTGSEKKHKRRSTKLDKVNVNNCAVMSPMTSDISIELIHESESSTEGKGC